MQPRTSRQRLTLSHSQVDNRYKRSLINNMLDWAYRLSSDWKYFSEECHRHRIVFSKLKHPAHLVNLNIKPNLALFIANIKRAIIIEQNIAQRREALKYFNDKWSCISTRLPLNDTWYSSNYIYVSPLVCKCKWLLIPFLSVAAAFNIL